MDKLKHACDALAFCSAALTVIGWLPVILGCIASAMSITWYAIRFYQAYKGKNNVNE